MHTYTPADSTFDGPITNLLSVLRILMEIFSGAHAKGVQSLNDFKFGIFIGHFPNDGVASMAMKGLMCIGHLLAHVLMQGTSVHSLI